MFVCLFSYLCVCVCVGQGVGVGLCALSPHFSGSGKWLYYHTSLSWLLHHITDIRRSLHFCPRQLWGCGDHVRNFSGALGLIGCVSYISDKYTHLSKVAENASRPVPLYPVPFSVQYNSHLQISIQVLEDMTTKLAILPLPRVLCDSVIRETIVLCSITF